MTEIEQYSFVTVVYGGDYGLMRLQARSLRLYLDRDMVREILVVESPQPGELISWRETLMREYGDLAPLVRFVEASEVSPFSSGVSGWFSQQVLKLMVSSLVAADVYVVLDGKNHLVWPLGRGDLQTPEGLLRSYRMSYEHHPMRDFLESTLAYFGLDLSSNVACFMPTTTPFLLPTRLVREMVRHVEMREGRQFAQAFPGDGYDKTEFFLFAAYLLSQGVKLEDIYAWTAAKNPAIWPESTLAESQYQIAMSEEGKHPFFAVHRRAFPNFDAETQEILAGYWQRRGLVASLGSGLRFLRNPNAPLDGSDLDSE